MSMVSTSDLELLFEEIPSDIYACSGQLSFYDRLTYYWAASKFYSGFGTIVDAGALIGGTARLLGYGLTKNTRIDAIANRIISYDLFEDVEGGFKATAIDAFPGFAAPAAIDGVIDFEPLFRENTKEFDHLIEIKRGDIMRIGYDNVLPIEVLSVDIGKTPELMHFVASEFFPRLIPEKSIVLNQDYIFPFQPWVLMAMERLSDFFVQEYEPPTECTTIHRLVRSITREDVYERLGAPGRAYFNLQNAALLDATIANASAHAVRASLRAAQIYAYWRLGRQRTAQEAARQFIGEFHLSSEIIQRHPGLVRFFTELGVSYAI